MKPTQNPTLPYPAPPRTPWFLHTQTSARNFKSRPHITSTTGRRANKPNHDALPCHSLPPPTMTETSANIITWYITPTPIHPQPPHALHPEAYLLHDTSQATIVTRAELDAIVHAYILCHVPWAGERSGRDCRGRRRRRAGLQPSKPTRGVRNGALSHKKSFKARPRSHPTTPGHYHKPPPLTKYDHPMWATLIVAFPSFTTPTNLIFRMSLVRFKALIHPQNLLVQATNERFLSAGGTFITIVVRATSEWFLPTGGHF